MTDQAATTSATPSPQTASPRNISLGYATPPKRFAGFVPGWRFARRMTQWSFLALFLYLVRATEATGEELLRAPANLFFRMDPLNAAAAMLAGRTFLYTFWPALVILLLTLFFGRFFCGWICPLGTLFDLVHRLFRPLTRRTNGKLGKWVAHRRPLRYALLVIVLFASILGLPIVGYLDPFSLLMRGWTIVIDPALFAGVSAAGQHIDSAPNWLQPPLTHLYDFLRGHALPFQQTAYRTLVITTALFAALFALELIARRFWCRFLCPLGALLGIAGRWSLLRRLPVKDCGKCKATSKCSERCRMGAFDGTGRLVGESCNLCMDCVAECPSTVARFKFKKPQPVAVPVGLSRRSFITAGVLGVALPVISRGTGAATPPPSELPKRLIRPPGVADTRTDEEFLNLCIRCGECLKVCTTNGLQPAALESGWSGLFSPVLTPRTGYCEVSCTLCAQVCPTGAIPRVPAAQKAKFVLGKAAFDRTRCLPWAKNEECLCCEEHCPVGEKAIQFETVKVIVNGKETDLQRPYVLHERCIGCGICENKCPVDGEAAIHVYRKDVVPAEGKGMQAPPSLPS